MAQTKAATVEAYLAGLPSERRETVQAVRAIILDHLPLGYEETMDFGQISYVVPVRTFPKTYNGHPLEYAALASQKQYISLYLMNVYGDKETERWFVERYKASGKKLNMGKSCVRFRTLDDLPLDLIGEVIARTPVARYLERYEALRRKS